MAERRMFAKSIIDSDAFLDMPLSTQALYFHLSMRADDEGFISNPKKIMRMIGSSQNEFDILIAKRYLLAFDSGIVVIKHWRIHNYIQKDRYKETLYIEEKQLLAIKENKSYTDTMDTECIQDGYAGKVRLGKVSQDKDNIEEDIKERKPKKETKNKYGEYKHVLLTKTEYNKLIDDWNESEVLRMIKDLDEGIELKGYKYKSHNLALRKWKSNETKKETNSKWNSSKGVEFKSKVL